MSDFEGLNLTPVVTKRASEAIYEQVKHKIIAGELKPGDRLPSERQLMDILERSRPTIREALRMLEREGFIKISAGTHGATVIKFGAVNFEQPLETMLQVSDITISELYEFRMQSECAIACWAAVRREPDDIELMEEMLRNASILIEDGKYEDFIATDTVFHKYLAQASRNEVACLINGVLHKITERFMVPVIARKTPDELQMMCRTIYDGHASIFTAICERNEDKSKNSMKQHLDAFSFEFR